MDGAVGILVQDEGVLFGATTAERAVTLWSLDPTKDGSLSEVRFETEPATLITSLLPSIK